MGREETGASVGVRLAAIQRSEQIDVDRLLSDVARQLKQKGYRVGGAIRSNEPKPGVHRCDVVLEELVSGQNVALGQELGPESRGCQLDPAALEQVAGLVDTSIEGGLDILILNKFGKRETEGAGLCGAIAQAASAEIPVLVSVGQDHLAAWREFCGGEGQILAPDQASIMNWLTDNLPAAPSA
jgi:uncharacterized protein DUF2478